MGVLHTIAVPVAHTFINPRLRAAICTNFMTIMLTGCGCYTRPPRPPPPPASGYRTSTTALLPDTTKIQVARNLDRHHTFVGPKCGSRMGVLYSGQSIASKLENPESPLFSPPPPPPLPSSPVCNKTRALIVSLHITPQTGSRLIRVRSPDDHAGIGSLKMSTPNSSSGELVCIESPYSYS
jgi:hypothetical protein